LLGLAAGALGSAALALGKGRSHRVGVLTPADVQWERAPFVDELSKLGLRTDDNLILDVRSAGGDLRRLPGLAAQMVADGVDLVVAANTPAAQAAIAATASHPIVIGIVADPILLGFVPSLSRPGGRITGVTNMAGEIAPKRLQVLKEAIPAASRILGLYHPDEPIASPQIRSLQEVAPSLALELKFVAVRTAQDLERNLQATEWPADAVFRLAGQGVTLEESTSRLALQYRLPVMSLVASGVRLGGLLSYFADHSALWRRAAHQVGRILGGDKPGDLPFERPSKFELAVNLRTAQTLGLTIPKAILTRADEVIE
jgi:putative ABC transport system substrate-binding protein